MNVYWMAEWLNGQMDENVGEYMEMQAEECMYGRMEM